MKSLARLPEHLNVVLYPCLLAIIRENSQARRIIARDFDIQVRTTINTMILSIYNLHFILYCL